MSFNRVSFPTVQPTPVLLAPEKFAFTVEDEDCTYDSLTAFFIDGPLNGRRNQQIYIATNFGLVYQVMLGRAPFFFITPITVGPEDSMTLSNWASHSSNELPRLRPAVLIHDMEAIGVDHLRAVIFQPDLHQDLIAFRAGLTHALKNRWTMSLADGFAEWLRKPRSRITPRISFQAFTDLTTAFERGSQQHEEKMKIFLRSRSIHGA